MLRQNIKKGVILNSEGRNLVIQKVGREAKGDYKCRAGNNVPSVGAMRESQLFHLDVKCKSTFGVIIIFMRLFSLADFGTDVQFAMNDFAKYGRLGRILCSL